MGVKFSPRIAAKVADHFHAENLQRQVKWELWHLLLTVHVLHVFV